MFKLKPKTFTIIALTAIILTTLFTYFNCLGSELVDFDDQFQITQNLDIRSLDFHNLQKIFSSFYLGMYQPLATLSFALEYKFFHVAPIFLHLDNILIHCLNILLVYWLTKLLFKKRSIALISTAFFALHPLQVESVAWVSARSNLLTSLFFLTSLIAYLYYLKKPQVANYLLALILFTVSLFSKVVTVGLPFILLLIDWQQHRQLFPIRHSSAGWNLKIWLEKIPFFALSLIFGLVAINSRGVTALVAPINYTWTQKLLFIPYSLLFYLSKLIFPFNLSVYYNFPELTNGWLPPVFYLAGLIFIGLTILLWRQRSNKNLVFFSLFFCLLITPSIQLKMFSTIFVAERYTYLAGLAYFWLISLTLVWLWQHYPKLKIWFIIFLLFSLPLFAGLSKIRTWAWQDNYSLWEDTLRHDPKSASVYENMANTLSRLGKLDEAMTYYDKALALEPNKAALYSDIATAIAKNSNDYVKAVEYYNQSIKLNPTDPLTYYNRANILLQKLNNLPAALLDYRQAVNLSNPKDVYYDVYLRSLARCYYENKQWVEALNYYNQAIDFYATPDTYFYRGLTQINLKQTAAGCQDLQEADKLGYKEAAEQINKLCKK